MNPIYIIAAMAALYYIPTLLKVLKLEFSVRSLFPVNITAEKIDLVLGLVVHNSGTGSVMINSMDIDVKLNNEIIGKLAGPVNRPVSSYREEVIQLPITLDYKTIGAELLSELIAGNLANFRLTLTGNVKADNRSFPFSEEFTAADL